MGIWYIGAKIGKITNWAILGFYLGLGFFPFFFFFKIFSFSLSCVRVCVLMDTGIKVNEKRNWLVAGKSEEQKQKQKDSFFMWTSRHIIDSGNQAWFNKILKYSPINKNNKLLITTPFHFLTHSEFNFFQ